MLGKSVMRGLILLSVTITAPAGDGIFPFDGATLDGWGGDLRYWRVEGGELIGESTDANPLPQSTYLIWKGDMPRDFDLTCKWKLQGGNSGIQYRSREVGGQSDLHGYQADMDAQDSYTGVLYEGLGRSLMSARGEQVEWDAAGKRVLSRFAPDDRLRAAIGHDGWNDYRIEARGTRLRHWINGTLMSDVVDGDASRFSGDGILALQLHAGPPMQVRFKEFVVRPIVDAPPVSALQVPVGFKAELLMSAQPSHGSWVCMTFDDRGRLVISPQQGPLIRLLIPEVSRGAGGEVWAGTEIKVEPLQTPIRGAQGLCCAHGRLFAVDARGKSEGGGLWSLGDADDDGNFEDSRRLVPTESGGEHGAHGVVAGPDGFLYWVIGNHVPLPEQVPIDHRLHQDDLVGEREWDPRGHAVGLHAPGGVVLRLDPDAESVEMLASGFRNCYDLAFDGSGELFTYDSDMEWDIGAPWYRAPRLVHVVKGGDYGWRSGSGKLPAWSIDTLPPSCDTDFSSPTGMAWGGASSFPEPWRSRMFMGDWTFGRILAADLTSQGARVTAQWVPFLSGTPMPVADFEFGPDGAMYFVTGGRGVQSGLYRISALHPTPATGAPGGAEVAARSSHERRRKLESLQRPLSEEAFEGVFPAIMGELDSEDQFLSHAARVALESQPVASWQGTVLSEERPIAAMAGLLALVRCGGAEGSSKAIARIVQLIQQDQLGAMQNAQRDQLSAMRIAEVALARHSELATTPEMRKIGELAVAAICSPDARVSRTAAELACALDIESAIVPAVDAMERASDRAAAMHYAFVLRKCKGGWTDSLRARYWNWLDRASDQRGGFSLGGFLQAMRADAAESVGRPTAGADSAAATGAVGGPSGAKAAVGSGSAAIDASAKTTGATSHQWTVAELERALGKSSGPRDLGRGRAVFVEAICIKCHRIHGDGGSNGPDLSGVASRFTDHDLLQAIIEPSHAVSDQYLDQMLELADGSLVIGRVVGVADGTLTVSTSPFTDERVQVALKDITLRETLATSSMPTGLLDSRTEADILDLLAYLKEGMGN